MTRRGKSPEERHDAHLKRMASPGTLEGTSRVGAPPQGKRGKGNPVSQPPAGQDHGHSHDSLSSVEGSTGHDGDYVNTAGGDAMEAPFTVQDAGDYALRLNSFPSDGIIDLVDGSGNLIFRTRFRSDGTIRVQGGLQVDSDADLLGALDVAGAVDIGGPTTAVSPVTVRDSAEAGIQLESFPDDGIIDTLNSDGSLAFRTRFDTVNNRMRVQAGVLVDNALEVGGSTTRLEQLSGNLWIIGPNGGQMFVGPTSGGEALANLRMKTDLLEVDGTLHVGGTPASSETDFSVVAPSTQIELVNTDLAAGSSGRRWAFGIGSQSGDFVFLRDSDDSGGYDSPVPMLRIAKGGATHVEALSSADNIVISDGYLNVNDAGSTDNYVRTPRLIVGESSTDNGQANIWGDLDVSGSKNAQIPDPDQPDTSYRFAADEAPHAGRLTFDYHVTIENGPATVELPEYVPRICRDPWARTPHPQGHPGSGAYAQVRDDWTVEVNGPPGDYVVEVVCYRRDPGVDNWQHIVKAEE